MRFLDIAEEPTVTGLVRVVEWLPGSCSVAVRWLPPSLLGQNDDADWPLLTAIYESREDAFGDVSRYLDRVIDDDADVPSLPVGVPAKVFAEVHVEIEAAIRQRQLRPPSWRRYRFISNTWDALDLMGTATRWPEVMSYRGILRMLAGASEDDEMLALAIEETAMALDAHQGSGLVWEAASRVSLVLGRHEDAIERASRACESMPEYALAWVQRAAAEKAMGLSHEESLSRARGLRHWEDSWELRARSGLGEGVGEP